MMDVEYIRREVQRLAQTIAGWNGLQPVPAIERDWVLEKLRSLYEAVRFEVETGAEEAGTVDVPADFELGEMLASETAAENETAAADTGSEPEPEPEPEPENPMENGEWGMDNKAQQFVSVSEPEPAVEQSVASEPILQTLFELEAASEGHRRKQRVIMSLYDTVPDEKTESGTGKTEREEPVPVQASRSKVENGAEQAVDVQEIAGQARNDREILSEEQSVAEAATKSLAETFAEERAAETFTELSVENFEPEAIIEEQTEIISEPEPEFGTEPESEFESEMEPAFEAEADFETEFDAADNTDAGETDHPVVAEPTPPVGISDADDEDSAFEEITLEPLPVVDLRSEIGLNDKFLIIRDLFNGDAAAYETTIDRLDAFDDLDDCMIYIVEHFMWNTRSDGAKALMEHLERKFA